MAPTSGTSYTLADVERAKYLWEEYRYRHDLIWRLLFRMTAVAVVLSIAPFTIDDLAEEEVGRWVNVLPALALVVVAVSGVVLQFEMELFTRIVREYGAAQDEIVEKPVRKEGPDIFALVIRWYPLALFVLVLAVALVAWTRC